MIVSKFDPIEPAAAARPPQTFYAVHPSVLRCRQLVQLLPGMLVMQVTKVVVGWHVFPP